MNLLEAVARWYSCDYGQVRCLGDQKCINYMFVDPRTEGERGVGPGMTGKRTLCRLLDDLNEQVIAKTEELDSPDE